MKRIFPILILLILATPSFAQMKSQNQSINIAKHTNSYTKVPAPSIYLNRDLMNSSPTSQFIVVFDAAVPENAKAAINEAAKIWSYIIDTGYPNNTSQPAIRIQVKWEDLKDNNVNASTDPPEKYINFIAEGIKQNVVYPVALANKLSQRDQNGSNPEMTITFNKTQPWYYGIDGNTPTDKTDLMTVMMHEIIHGLGFTGSFQVSSDGTGSWGEMIGDQKYPWIFDCYVANNLQNSVIDNPSVYENPSTDLGAFLKGGNVFFNGSNAMRMTGSSNLPRLYGPSEWSSGSSIYHLDDDTYPAGSSNSLMTPGTGYAEAIHSPGEIVISALMDMGWDVNRLFTITSPKAGIAWQFGTTQTIKWTDNKFGYIAIELMDMSNNVIKNLTSATNVNSNQGTLNEFTWTIPSNIPASTYRIRMHDMENDYGFSDPFQISSQGQCLPVAISPGSGEYSNSITVTMQSPEQGVTIRYTMDGSTPTSNSTQYTSTSPITLNADATIKASAFKSGYKESLPTVVTYRFSSYAHINVTYRDENNINYDNDINWWSLWVNGQWKSTWSGWRPIAISPADNIYIKVDARYIIDTKKFYSIKNDVGLIKYDNYSTYAALNPTGEGTYQKQYIATFISAKKATIQNVFEDPGFSVGSPNNTLGFSDPWYYDKTDAVKGQYNSGLNSTLIQRNSPFIIDTDINSANGKLYKGVFLNAGGTNLNSLLPPYYSISAKPYYDITLPQTGKTYRFEFQNWSTTGALVNQNDLTTPVIFQQANASVFANYKASNLSNCSGAFANNSQKKLVHIYGGWSEKVYESMNKIWLESSTDNGKTWALAPRNPISGAAVAHSPAIDIPAGPYPYEYIVYSTSDASGSKVMLTINFENLFRSTIDVSGNLPFSNYDFQPVIAIKENYTDSKIIVVWHQPYMDYFDPAGFYYRVGTINPDHTVTWNNSRYMDYTENCSNPAIVASKTLTDPNQFHLTYQEDMGYGDSRVSYLRLDLNSDNTISYSNGYEVSQGSGYYVNTNPSITLFGGLPKVSWIGYDRVVTYMQDALFRSKDGSFSWGSVYTYVASGNNTVSVSLDKVGTSGYILGYGDEYGDIRYVKSTSLSTVRYADNTGNYVQVKGGPDFNNSFIESFHNESLPYYFSSSSAVSVLGKTNTETISGRGLNITKDGLGFSFNLKDVRLDGNQVDFTEESDSALSQRNIIETKAFSVGDNSELTYSYSYFTSDSAKVLMSLKDGEVVNYSLDLVDATSKEILKNLVSVSYSNKDVNKKRPECYKLLLKGIGNRTVKLRISSDVDLTEASGLLSTIAKTYSTGSGLKKNGFIEVKYSDVKPVVEYGLSQNYPNPFNPTTVINYQIPQASKVMLKIYDMLGKEVTTLVNEYKEQGRYSVEFNASSLPSGTYIYEIRANDFIKSGKMILLK